MFNRCAMHAEEDCEFAFVYPVPAEQEQSLALLEHSARSGSSAGQAPQQSTEAINEKRTGSGTPAGGRGE
jgi:hypothetical protein